MKKIIVLALLLILTSFFTSCETKVPASVVMTSSTLASSTVTNAIPGAKGVKASAGTCPSDKECLTPINVEGKIYYAGIMVGDESGYSLGLLGPIEGTEGLTTYAVSTTFYDFDFSDQLKSDSDGITCCGGSAYPADDDAYVSRIEITFGYLDATFEISTGDISGAHTVRFVYGDVDALGYKKGDVLYKDSAGSFNWCDSSVCTHSTRPSSPVQNADILAYSGTPDGMGSQVIPSFSASVTNTNLQMTQTEVLANSWDFTIDFNMTNGLSFDQDPSNYLTVIEMLNGINLVAEPGSTDEGFSASITAVKSALEEANYPKDF
ncbi:MAG: hypothetical protein ABIA04_08800 [Pseudomonadota bacterium]